MQSKQKGITLIALIITIIVMLILVGVTINVALNGGLFDTAKEATFKQELSQMQEALQEKKVVAIAQNNGELVDLVESNTFELISDSDIDLELPEKLKEKYGNKIGIGKKPNEEVKLFYDANSDLTEAERQWLQDIDVIAWEADGDANDFEIEIAQVYDSDRDSVIITVSPKITKDTFTESEAIKIVGQYIGKPNIDAMEQLVLEGYNYGNEPDLGTYNDVMALVGDTVATEMGVLEPDVYDAANYLFKSMNFNDISYESEEERKSTVRKLAATIYTPTSVLLKIDGTPITTGVTQNGKEVTYELEKNDEYVIELILDNNKNGADEITITAIDEDILGDYLQYDEELWRVLYNDETNGLQMIKVETITCSIGADDPITEGIVFEEITGTDNLNDEKCMYSYNKIIETLNTACYNSVKLNDKIIDVRCAGTNPTQKTDENEDNYISNNIPSYANDALVGQDENYRKDKLQMQVIGYEAYNPIDFASRRIWEKDGNINFGIWTYQEDREVNMFGFKIDGTGGHYLHGSAMVLPVAILSENALEGLEGKGTKTIPYILE